MMVRQLVLPPDVYELLPDYAVKGYLYSLADGGFAFGKWEGPQRPNMDGGKVD